jgi:phage host-nuclease inhibitor protein Gam
MPKRVKLSGPSIQTREQMEACVGDICRLTIFMDQTKALMDQRLTEIRSEYEEQLAGADEKINQLMALARDWAESHQEAFGPRKSIDMMHGTVGFRTGQPTLKTATGWTWARVLEVLSPCYIRTKQEPAKENILADRDILGADGLRKFGLRVDQSESFFVEPTRDQLSPAAISEPAA